MQSVVAPARRAADAGAGLAVGQRVVCRRSRRDQLSRALERFEGRKVDVVFIEDEQSKVRATAQWAGSPRKPFVRFY